MKVILIGGRGTAIVIADQICDAHERFGMDIEVIGLALDDRSGGNDVSGYPILCGIKELNERYGHFSDVKFIYSLYRPDVMEERTRLLYELDIPKDKFFNFVHPSVMLSRSAVLGIGNVFLSNVVINSNAVVGNFNTVNSGTLLGHDIKIGDNNYFAGQVCVGSGLQIGDMNFVGLNSSLRNGISMGNANIVGMASNITKNVGDKEVLYGNPARKQEKLNPKLR